ncbi:MAG TPA: porin family protein [Chitinophagaceae bacterium]|nr:porin family protein [Chitinophagaceae bacterium]
MRSIFVIFFMLYFLPAEAQWRLGFRAGLNGSNLVHRSDRHDKRTTGAVVSRLNGGLLLEIPLEDQWYINTGIHYSGKGANMFASDSTMKKDSERVRLNYLEIPVMVVYKFPSEKENQFILSSGPYIGYGFNGTINWKGGFIPTKDQVHRKEEEEYRRFELGWMISAIYEIKSRYGLRLDFSKSLLNIQHPETRQKNIVIGFSFYWFLKEMNNE